MTTLLEAGSLKSDSWYGWFLLEALRARPFHVCPLALGAPATAGLSLARSRVTAISAFALPRPSFLGLFVSSRVTRTLLIRFRARPVGAHLEILNLIISAQRRSPSKQWLGVTTRTCLFGGTRYSTHYTWARELD